MRCVLQALFGQLTTDVVILTVLYSLAGLGIAIVNDFKSIEGDRYRHHPRCVGKYSPSLSDARRRLVKKTAAAASWNSCYAGILQLGLRLSELCVAKGLRHRYWPRLHCNNHLSAVPTCSILLIVTQVGISTLHAQQYRQVMCTKTQGICCLERHPGTPKLHDGHQVEQQQ